MLVICAWCKALMYQTADGLKDHGMPSMSHGICPTCLRLHFPDFIAQVPAAPARSAADAVPAVAPETPSSQSSQADQ